MFFKKSHPGFVPFIVVGDPHLEASRRAVDLLIECGADAIELGVPFSDALADGPVIQAASERAATRVSLGQVLDFATTLQTAHPGFPFVLFTYYNPIYKMGRTEFAKRASQAGISAVLVVDLPPEEASEHTKTLEEFGVATVFLASPTTPPERFALIERSSTGFIYYVSRTGVTGVQSQVSQSLEAELAAVRRLTQKQIAVGFGISTGEQARQVSRLADAVVVGSAFVKLLSLPDLEQGFKQIESLAREMNAKIKGHETGPHSSKNI